MLSLAQALRRNLLLTGGHRLTGDDALLLRHIYPAALVLAFCLFVSVRVTKSVEMQMNARRSESVMAALQPVPSLLQSW
jgi:hypothetical protein